MATSDLNFWSSDKSHVQTDSSPNYGLPPLDSINFFTSSNFMSSLPSETEDSNRTPTQSRRRVETDSDEAVENDNRNGSPWRQTQVDTDEGHTEDNNCGWEDSNRWPTVNDTPNSLSGQRQRVVATDNETDDSGQLYPSRAVKDTDDNIVGAMSGAFRYIHSEPPSQNLSVAKSDDSFSVPSIDSRQQLKGKMVRRVETDSPMVDPQQLKAMKKPETELGLDEEESTEMEESQVSVITQETEDFPSSLTMDSSAIFHPPVVNTVPPHTLHSTSQSFAVSTLSANLGLRSDPSNAVRPPSSQASGALYSAASVQFPAATGLSHPKQQQILVSSDIVEGGSLPSRLSDRRVNSLPFPTSAPVSPSAHFLCDSSQHVAPSKRNKRMGRTVVADSPHLANVHQLPSMLDSKQHLTPSLPDTPEMISYPLATSGYFLPQDSGFDGDQLMSLPSYINDPQGHAQMHYQHGACSVPIMGSQFGDYDQPMSLPLSTPPMSLGAPDVNSLFPHPHLPPMQPYIKRSEASELSFSQPEVTAVEEPYDNVKHGTEGSEEFTTPLGSLGKEEKTPLIKLVQQYLQEKAEGILTHSPPSTTQQEFTTVPSAGHQHDSDNLMKKELDKAFERISDLEVRVQDLTLQLTVELPDDNEITHLSLEKLQQEYKRMKELKRRAEQQNIEARMSSQRLIAENHRLKEELSQVKEDRQAILQQFSNLKKEIHSRQQDASKKAQSMKLAVTLALTDGGHTGSLSLHSVTAAVFPSMTITMDVFSSIIARETASYNSSLIITFGQAGAGKTSLLRAIDNLAGVPVTPRGQQSSLQVYEILSSKDAISTETKWSPQAVHGFAAKLFSTIVAKSCSKKKRSPSFDVDQNTQGRPVPPKTKVDFYKKKLYEAVKRVVEVMEDNGQLSDLNISTPSSLTFFDLGSDSAATLLLPHLLSQSKPPVLLDAVSLEEVQSLLPGSRGGSLTQEDEAYTSLTAEDLPLQLPSHLESTLEFAKSLQKHQQQQSFDSSHPITLIIACMHTDSFARGKNIQDLVRKLKHRLVLAAAEKGIVGKCNVYTVSVCQDDSYGYDNASLLQLKKTIENAAGSSGSVPGSGKVPARWVLLQGMLQDLGKNHLSLVEVSHYGRQCGIALEEELHQFLALQHESGNLLYLPNARSQLLRGVVITDVVRLLEKILRLFYYQRQLIEVGSSVQTSLPPSGISDSTLRTVVQEDSDLIIHLLSEFKLCETSTYKGMEKPEKSYTLFPHLLPAVS